MNRTAVTILTPLSGLYGLAMKVRRGLYRRGLFRAHEIGVPVISVGNLTTGGTGKTPLVEWICRELARETRHVCILTRGYGRANPRRRVIVSSGFVLSDVGVAEAGDEAILLAERLQGLAAVISDADRVAAARWAVANWRTNVFVLDDGFQNLRMARGLNIVTIDATNPWGNGRILPAGILREDTRELSRADCVVITRADDPEQTETLRHQIRLLNERAVILSSRMKTRRLRRLNSKRQETGSQIKAAPAAAFCAIGNPESFFDQLRRDGHTLCHTRAFRDHHVYSQTDIDGLLREAIARGAEALITTAKDEVKLRSLHFTLPCYVADLTIEIEDEDNLRSLIAEASRARYHKLPV